MTVPPIDIGQPDDLDQQTRDYLVDALNDLAHDVKSGTLGTVPSGLPGVKRVVNVPGVREITVTVQIARTKS